MPLTMEKAWLKYLQTKDIYTDGNGNYYSKINNNYSLIVGTNEHPNAEDLSPVDTNEGIVFNDKIINGQVSSEFIKSTNFNDIYFIEDTNEIITHGHSFGPGIKADEKLAYDDIELIENSQNPKAHKVLLAADNGGAASRALVNNNIFVKDGKMYIGEDDNINNKVVVKSELEGLTSSGGSGSINLGDFQIMIHFNDRYPVNADEWNIRVYQIKFNEPFAGVPRIYATIQSATVWHVQYVDIQLTTCCITENGFVIEVMSKSDTCPNIEWMAVYNPNESAEENNTGGTLIASGKIKSEWLNKDSWLRDPNKYADWKIDDRLNTFDTTLWQPNGGNNADKPN